LDLGWDMADVILEGVEVDDVTKSKDRLLYDVVVHLKVLNDDESEVVLRWPFKKQASLDQAVIEALKATAIWSEALKRKANEQLGLRDWS
jgi:hypothetical protein